MNRAAIVSTAVIAALVVLGVWALWPSPGGGTDAPAPPGAGAGAERAAPAGPPPPCPGPSGSPVPAGPLAGVTATCLDGSGTTDIGAALAGRPALINVWASWCLPCRTELPALAEYAARPDAAAVLLVNVRDQTDAALSLLAALDIRLPSVADPTGTVRAALQAPPVLPLSYVLRPDGSLVAVQPPTPFRTADEVAATVTELSGSTQRINER